ncbi:MAG: hydantoinase/oxoprolinase family protein [Burkholderiaceae bacterium]
MSDADLARIGVDIGGTFTDVVIQSGARLVSQKVLTTHVAPEQGILEGVRAVLAKAGIDAGRVRDIVHGTTLATNALIERRGAHTAFVTTAGFRDVIEMRTESRFEQYDLNLRLPDPLIAREHRHVLYERIGAQGQVLIGLDEGEVAALADRLGRGGYESVAIGLIHSYANPAHERRVAQILRDRLPRVSLSISSEVSPQMREYARFNTVCANAYVKPLMRAYLLRLREALAGLGIDAPVYMMHSGGGIVSLDSAAEFPVRLVESGPAGGAIFAARLAQAHGLTHALSFDMGGTTAKICLIRDHTPKTARVFEVARTYRFKKGSGMPISIPVIDMVEIGAGGGSLAHVDALRQIRVGPRSAGSEPGPACYGRGGSEPAVTDADLLLGRLDAHAFAGGSFDLQPQAAERAVEQAIATPLSMSMIEAANGIAEVVDENMANAARVHAVENGEDLADYTMIAFGGAAPIHAGRLCQKLGMQRVLVPSGAGVGSAIGFLGAPYSFEATRGTYLRLSDFDPGLVRETLAALTEEATVFVRRCDAQAAIGTHARAYMRYVGQGWEIPVSLPAAACEHPDADDYRARFEVAYEHLFGRTVEGLDIELTGFSLEAGTAVPRVQALEAVADAGGAPIESRRRLFDPITRQTGDAGVCARERFQVGQSLAGPAVITEAETTIIVPRGFVARLLADGTFDLTRAPD